MARLLACMACNGSQSSLGILLLASVGGMGRKGGRAEGGGGWVCIGKFNGYGNVVSEYSEMSHEIVVSDECMCFVARPRAFFA